MALDAYVILKYMLIMYTFMKYPVFVLDIMITVQYWWDHPTPSNYILTMIKFLIITYFILQYYCRTQGEREIYFILQIGTFISNVILFLDIRLRCLSIVVGTVTFITMLLAIQGWGPAALQDHWAAQPKVHYDTSAPFMALYGLFNFKMYILAYLFSPGGGSIHGKIVL